MTLLAPMWQQVVEVTEGIWLLCVLAAEDLLQQVEDTCELLWLHPFPVQTWRLIQCSTEPLKPAGEKNSVRCFFPHLLLHLLLCFHLHHHHLFLQVLLRPHLLFYLLLLLLHLSSTCSCISSISSSSKSISSSSAFCLYLLSPPPFSPLPRPPFILLLKGRSEYRSEAGVVRVGQRWTSGSCGSSERKSSNQSESLESLLPFDPNCCCFCSYCRSSPNKVIRPGNKLHIQVNS